MVLLPGALQWLLGGFSIKPQPRAAGDLKILVLFLSKMLLPSTCKTSLACPSTGMNEHFYCPPASSYEDRVTHLPLLPQASQKHSKASKSLSMHGLVTFPLIPQDSHQHRQEEAIP